MSGIVSSGLAGWLTDTLLYTGLLIALVLLVRRPVSRHFGPQVAYALWALPLLRLVMPPLVLPAWLAPAETASAVREPVMIILSDAPEAAAATAPTVGIGLLDLALPLWLGGAAIFLASRARSYMRMRRELLDEARPVGEAGRVRLVETPAVTSPIAFGVRDKVVALPPCFMAWPDRNARDLAIAHELAHHRGHDLLANIAAQPLLALHWFNPLAWWGWRAMRKDQEAACDARVVAGREKAERAAYAQVIAGFAAGDDFALAAPMACPMLGEKSIIHRLRSLTMSEVTPARRRLGKTAIGAAALALPLTASISYAAPEITRSTDAPAPPAPPEAPAAPLAPDAPQPPEAPAAPPAPEVDADPAPEPVVERRVETRVIRRVDRDTDPLAAFNEEEFEREMEALGVEMARLENLDEVIEMALAEAERAKAESARIMAENPAGRVSVTLECEGDEPVVERELSDGRRAIMICTPAITAQAAQGLREARREIARNSDIPAENRERILRQLDRQIDGLTNRPSSHMEMPAVPTPPATPVVRVSYSTSFATKASACEEGRTV